MKSPALTGRRAFLKAIGASAFAATPSFGVLGANEQVRLGVIGCGGRGQSLASQFHGLEGVRIVAISDADTVRMDKLEHKLKGSGDFKPDKHQDYRKLLEQSDVDAVIIASPNHWHALHTIHACQAGKDVYVEKPVTHKMSEGVIMLEAERKYGRIIQAGTQNRSDSGLIPACEFIRSGEIGRITSIRGLCFRNRKSIGRAKNPPLKPPSSVDYDLWLGPADDLPLERKSFHYDWHWIWNTGDGDVGNQAPHELDLISWFTGDPGTPSKLCSFGGRFAWDDAGETPNIQTLWYEQGGVPVVFEVNDLRVKPGTNAASAYKGLRVGTIVTCEGGEFRGGRGGGYVVAPDGKTRLKKFPGDGGGGHARNFIDAIRSRKSSDLNGQLARSCDSAAISHLANLSIRTGKPARVSDLREAVLTSSPELRDVLDRQQAQLDRWSVDLAKAPYILGSEVTFDPKSRMPTGPLADTAFLKLGSRGDFGFPDKV